MTGLIAVLILGAILLPLLVSSGLAISFCRNISHQDAVEPLIARWSAGSSALTLGLLLMAGLLSLLQPSAETTLRWDWLASGNLQLSLSLRVDGRAVLLALLFSWIIWLVSRFSASYLHRETGFRRYFMVLSLFHAALLLSLLAGDLLTFFIGWELTGVCSYLLIAYSWQREEPAESATRTFLTNRMGDAGFLLALILALPLLGGEASWSALTHTVTDSSQGEAQAFYGGLIALCLLLPALIKAAQFPFSAWLTGALEGPTPSSAVFYGALLVHLGIYLLLRLSPMLEQLPLLRHGLLLTGLLTLAYGWLCALVTADLKTSLSFATLTQLGLMVVLIALGWTTAATLLLITHICWRSYQFLHAPSFMQLTQRPADPAPAWLNRYPVLYQAALNRFWLNKLADGLLVRPTYALAREARQFDEAIFSRFTGSHAIHRAQTPPGTGLGVPGRVLQRLATGAVWFEEKLILRSSERGLAGLVSWLASYIEQIEWYLSKPRYLLLLIAATLVVIL